MRRDIAVLTVWTFIFGYSVALALATFTTNHLDAMTLMILASAYSGVRALLHAHRISIEVDDRDLLAKYNRDPLAKELTRDSQ